jgi:hypothetical protein
MPFVLPQFNVNVAFWRFGRATSLLPDVVTIGNLSPGRLVTLDTPLGDMYLRLPKGTDVQDAKNGLGVDTCECPFTSGRFYTVQFVDDIGGGFTNEHRVAVLAGTPNWPTPFPPVGGFTPIVPPSPPSFITAFSSLPGGGGPQTPTFVTTGGSIGGCFCVFNSVAVPIVTVNGRPNCVLSGGGADVGQAPFGQPTLHIYPFMDIGVVGANNIVLDPNGIFPQFFFGYISSGMGTGSALTLEGAAFGAGGPVIIPPYTPNPAHPKVHMVYGCGYVPTGAQGWVAPYGLFGASSPALVLGTNMQMWGGIFLAGAGGQFPAHSTGIIGPWVAIQHSYVP